MVKSKVEQLIIDCLENIATNHGIDIVDVEVVGASKAPCVRVRIDKLDGEAITLDEVTAQNRWISDALDELDPISTSYTLEVSSPGINRPLRRLSDFEAHVGEKCELSLNVNAGRKRFAGVIASVDDGIISLTEGEETHTFSLEDIKKAHLKPEIDFGNKKEGK